MVLTSTHNLGFEQKHEKYQNFLSENFQFLVIKFSVCLNRHVFVMVLYLSISYHYEKVLNFLSSSLGTPVPTVTWSRDDGPLPEDAILGEGILIIPSAKIEDAGTYTCLAQNEAGSVSSKFVLYVKGEWQDVFIMYLQMR